MTNVYSDLLTNRDATPRVPNNAYVDGGRVRKKLATVAKGAETDGSTWRFFSIHSSAVVSSVKWSASAITGFTAIDIGLYDTTANGGAAVSDALFASAVDMHAGAGWTEVLGAGQVTPDKIEKRVWELLGLSADPFKDYDVVMTGDTAGTNTGNLGLMIEYDV